MRTRVYQIAFGFAVAGIAVAGSAQANEIPPVGVVQVHSASGTSTSGTLFVIGKGNRLTLSGTVTGLTPGDHGMHIHEFGNCTSPDAKSAGSHFNPDKSTHGGLSGTRHAGDLGNISADASGKAVINVDLPVPSFESIAGRSLVIHAKADDLKTDPSGNPGHRVGCGVIGHAGPSS